MKINQSDHISLNLYQKVLGYMSTSRYGVVVKFTIHMKGDTLVWWTDHQNYNQNHFTEPKNVRSGGIPGDFLYNLIIKMKKLSSEITRILVVETTKLPWNQWDFKYRKRQKFVLDLISFTKYNQMFYVATGCIMLVESRNHCCSGSF